MQQQPAAQRYKVALEEANRNLKKLSDAGVTIAMGTDTGPPARFQGYFELMELEMMAKAGLTPRQVLASATRDAARCMKLDKRSRHARAEQVGRLRCAGRRSAQPISPTSERSTAVWIAGKSPCSGEADNRVIG